MLYHKHALIKAFVRNAPKEEQILNTWMTQLVSDIDMKIVLPARSCYVATEGNSGLTGSCNIETSHIAIHIWDDVTPNRIEMDVYSCKDFDIQTILEALEEWDLLSYHYWIIDRNGQEFKLIEEETAEEIFF